MTDASVIMVSIDEIVADLDSLLPLTEDGPLDVRLRCYESNSGGYKGTSWEILYGDPGYDTTHLGYWGYGTLELGDDLNILARDLLDEAREDYYMQKSV